MTRNVLFSRAMKLSLGGPLALALLLGNPLGAAAQAPAAPEPAAEAEKPADPPAPPASGTDEKPADEKPADEKPAEEKEPAADAANDEAKDDKAAKDQVKDEAKAAQDEAKDDAKAAQDAAKDDAKAAKDEAKATKKQAKDAAKDARDDAKDAGAPAKDAGDDAADKPADATNDAPDAAAEGEPAEAGSTAAEGRTTRNGNAGQRQDLGLSFTAQDERLTVSNITRTSVIGRAGVRRGDVIMSVNGNNVVSQNEFNRYLYNVTPGERATIIVLRDGREETLYIEDLGPAQSARSGGATLGVVIDTRHQDEVVIREARRGGAADEAGLRAGDALLSIDGQQFNTLQEMKNVLNQHQPGDEVEVEFARGEAVQTVAVQLDAAPAARSNVRVRSNYQGPDAGVRVQEGRRVRDDRNPGVRVDANEGGVRVNGDAGGSGRVRVNENGGLRGRIRADR